ncbi:MAG: hypothetical protein LBS83_00640 [Holosporales bacterium]|nr:hypothetical protein [Holosporales bacterium]
MRKLSFYVYKNSVSVFSETELIEELSCDTEQLCEKLHKIILEKKPSFILALLYLNNIYSNIINVSKISLYDTFLLKNHAKKIELEQDRVILNNTVFKTQNEKRLLISSGSYSDLSKKILYTLNKNKITVNKINCIQQFFLEKSISKKNNKIENAWECVIFRDNCFLINKSENTNVLNIAIKYCGKVVILREFFDNNIELLTEEIVQTFQYIRKFGYNGEKISILYPDSSDLNGFTELISKSIQCEVSMEVFQEKDKKKKLFSVRNINLLEKAFWRLQIANLCTAGVLLLCFVISIQNLSRMSKEVKKQNNFLLKSSLAADLPLSKKELRKKKEKSEQENCTLELWCYKMSRSWSESHFWPLFEKIFSEAHRENFLVKVEYKIADDINKKKVVRKYKANKKGEESKKLVFNAIFSPSVFYKDFIQNEFLERELRKHSETIKRDIYTSLSKQLQSFSIDFTFPSNKSFNIKVDMPNPIKVTNGE